MMEQIIAINFCFLVQSPPGPRDTASAQLPRNCYSSRLSATAGQREYLATFPPWGRSFSPALFTQVEEVIARQQGEQSSPIFVSLDSPVNLLSGQQEVIFGFC
jgi:hypothetical protein